MGAWEKLEEKLNILIERLMRLLGVFVSKSTPKSIKASIDNRRGKPLIDIKEVQAKIISLKTNFDSIKLKLTTILGRAILFIQSINFKKETLTKAALWSLTLIAPFTGRIKLWYLALKPTTILAIVSVTTVGGLSSVAIYQQVQKISDESRAPASAQVRVIGNQRPDYYKQQERELRIRNINFPIYIGKKSGKKLMIDFTFITSNKYIKSYFYDNVHLLRDKLNTSVEQIQVEFPLEDDGKRVIKEKLMKEMQSLIDELGIEGSIEEIYIHSIMTG